MHRVVPDREAVDGRPQAPAPPAADVRVRLARGHERREVTDLRRDDGRPAQVGLIAEVGEGEDYQEREEAADGGEGVGRDGVPA